MQAIRTHYLCPTNTKGGRIKAACQAGSIILGWDHSLDPEDNHKVAAHALCQRIEADNAKKYGGQVTAGQGWLRKKACGQLADGSWVHVFV